MAVPSGVSLDRSDDRLLIPADLRWCAHGRGLLNGCSYGGAPAAALSGDLHHARPARVLSRPAAGGIVARGPLLLEVADGLPRRPTRAAPPQRVPVSRPVGWCAGWRTAGTESILERRPSPRNPGRRMPPGTARPFACKRSDSSQLRSWRPRSPASGVRPRRASATAARTAPAAAHAHRQPRSRPPTSQSTQPRSPRSAIADTRAPSAVRAHGQQRLGPFPAASTRLPEAPGRTPSANPAERR